MKKYLSAIALGITILMGTSELALADTTNLRIDPEYVGDMCLVLGSVGHYNGEVIINSGPYQNKIDLHNELRPRRYGIPLFFRGRNYTNINVTADYLEPTLFQGSCNEAKVISVKLGRWYRRVSE